MSVKNVCPLPVAPLTSQVAEHTMPAPARKVAVAAGRPGAFENDGTGNASGSST
jgi:hypothetical protein